LSEIRRWEQGAAAVCRGVARFPWYLGVEAQDANMSRTIEFVMGASPGPTYDRTGLTVDSAPSPPKYRKESPLSEAHRTASGRWRP